MKTLLAVLLTILCLTSYFAHEAYTVKVTQIEDRISGTGLQIIGTITNNTTTSFLSALITVTLYDAHQKILETLNGSVQNADGVLPGKTAVWTGVVDGALHATQVEYVKAVPALVTPQ
jgi:hypothetical protein